jgi:hypothetical protein
VILSLIIIFQPLAIQHPVRSEVVIKIYRILYLRLPINLQTLNDKLLQWSSIRRVSWHFDCRNFWILWEKDDLLQNYSFMHRIHLCSLNSNLVLRNLTIIWFPLKFWEKFGALPIHLYVSVRLDPNYYKFYLLSILISNYQDFIWIYEAVLCTVREWELMHQPAIFWISLMHWQLLLVKLDKVAR